MSILKCKMCGGDLEVTEETKIAECEYCGTKQTVAIADNEKKINLFNRANRLRIAGEFDKAVGIYENIAAEFSEEAEAYWGLCLCNHGIEYVDDPVTAKKIPTCHRASYESILNDENYEMALEYADVVAQKVYRDEAREIDRIQKEILALSQNEKPYDVFICYKETDENGTRTVDSVLAQDIYDALADKGYKVFFARITLEDKLGMQYEPYIFAALNSAKVMLAIGTKYEYFHAVWVKNEWSRFLKLMSKDKSKVLIPCYKDIDAYDIPEEFKMLQAQDMGKIGAVQDLVRGVGKLITAGKPAENVTEKVVVNSEQTTTEPLIKRAFMFLEDGNWDKADEYCERVLDIDPENSRAYLGKLLAKYKLTDLSDLKTLNGPIFESNSDYKNAYLFADDETKDFFKSVIAFLKEKALHKEEVIKKYNHYVQGFLKAGAYHTVGLKTDGTVVAAGDNKYGQCNILGWKGIIAISAGEYHTVGLKSDGTVVAVGNYENGECNTLGWNAIVAISAGYYHTVGLKSDGTVVAVGDNKYGQCNISGWKDIVAISAGYSHTVGLKTDGTIVAVGSNHHGQCNVSGWNAIVAISAAFSHAVGLKTDGTVVAVGSNLYGQCNISGWKDIIAISAGYSHTVGLKSDGTVVAVGNNADGQCNISGWKDIIAISAGYYHTVGLKSNGTVVATGNYDYGRCNVSDWKLFYDMERMEKYYKYKQKCIENIKATYNEYFEKLEKEKAVRIAALEKEKAALEAELPTLKGLLKISQRKEVEARLAQINRELNK